MLHFKFELLSESKNSFPKIPGDELYISQDRNEMITARSVLLVSCFFFTINRFEALLNDKFSSFVVPNFMFHDLCK